MNDSEMKAWETESEECSKAIQALYEERREVERKIALYEERQRSVWHKIDTAKGIKCDSFLLCTCGLHR